METELLGYQDTHQESAVSRTCFKVVTDSVFRHPGYFAGAVQHPELVHI